MRRIKNFWSFVFLLFALGLLTVLIAGTKTPKEDPNLSEAKNLMQKIENGEGDSGDLMREITFKVGPEAAIKLLNASSLPRAGQSHLIAHSIGEVAYELYGEEALAYCGEDSLNGCAHGLILTAITDIGFDGIKRMVEKCNNLSVFKYHMCLHAAGHAFMALAGYQVFEGLEYCDRLNPESPELYHCYNGVFMENVHGEHDGKSAFERAYLSKNDLMKPCNIVSEKYKSACYLNQVGWWYEVFGHDLQKTAKECGKVPQTYQKECADNFGRTISTAVRNDRDKIKENCRLLADPLDGFCLSGIAQSLFALGDENLPFELCQAIFSKSPKEACYQGLSNLTVRQNISEEKTSLFCSKYEEEFRYLCQ